MKTLALLMLLCSLAVAQTPAANPNDPAELVKQGRKLAGEGKLDDALALYRKASAADPSLYGAHLSAGSVLDLKGEYPEARKEFDKAIATANTEQKTSALRSMAVSYAFESKAAESAKYEKQAFDLAMAKPDYIAAAEIANEQARLYIEAGDLDNAFKWYQMGYQTALQKSDLKDEERALWDFRWHHAQARIAARRGKHDEAMKHVEEAKAALDKANNPDQQRFYPYLTGYVAYYNQDYKTAIADLQKVNPPDPFILVLLAQAQEKTGDSAGAMENYKKALASNAHNPTNAFARPIARKKVK